MWGAVLGIIIISGMVNLNFPISNHMEMMWIICHCCNELAWCNVRCRVIVNFDKVCMILCKAVLNLWWRRDLKVNASLTVGSVLANDYPTLWYVIIIIYNSSAPKTKCCFATIVRWYNKASCICIKYQDILNPDAADSWTSKLKIIWITNLRNVCQRFIKVILTFLISLWSAVDCESETAHNMYPTLWFLSLEGENPRWHIFITFCGKENDLITCVQHFNVWKLHGNIS